MSSIREIPRKNGIHYYLKDGNHTKKLQAKNRNEALLKKIEYDHNKACGSPNSLLIQKRKFDILLNEYITYAKIKKTPKTLSRDMSVIKQLRAAFKNKNVNAITDNDIYSLQLKWLNNGNSKKTVNTKSMLLKAILGFAKKKHHIINFPNIEFYKTDELSPIWFKDNEIELIRSNGNQFQKDYFDVYYYTGMRLGEVQKLKWVDIDFINRFITVREAKSHKSRKIPINEILFALINRLYEGRTKNQIYLFENKEKFPFQDYYHNFKKLLKKIDVKGHIHQIRHTTATNLCNAKGANLLAIKELLGHASIKTTERYCHVKDQTLIAQMGNL